VKRGTPGTEWDGVFFGSNFGWCFADRFLPHDGGCVAFGDAIFETKAVRGDEREERQFGVGVAWLLVEVLGGPFKTANGSNKRETHHLRVPVVTCVIDVVGVEKERHGIREGAMEKFQGVFDRASGDDLAEVVGEEGRVDFRVTRCSFNRTQVDTPIVFDHS